MILLTIGALLGRPDWGLFAVTIWTVATSLFLIIRLAMAVSVRLVAGPIRSWFLDIDQTNQQQSLAVRLFTHKAVD